LSSPSLPTIALTDLLLQLFAGLLRLALLPFALHRGVMSYRALALLNSGGTARSDLFFR
jgi:hypothetical protein